MEHTSHLLIEPKIRLEEKIAERRDLEERLAQMKGPLQDVKKQVKKDKKLILRTEERCFMMGYKATFVAAHSAGLGHKAILMNLEDDPVGFLKVEDEPVVVSTNTESNSSSP